MIGSLPLTIATLFGGGASPFTPESLAPDYYWRADSGVDETAGAVNNWADSIAAVTGSQTNATKKPTYSAADANWNGQPSLASDAADFLLIDAADLPAASQKFFHDDSTEWEIAIPYRPAALPSTRALIGTNNAGGSGAGFVVFSDANGVIRVLIFNGTTSNVAQLSAGALVAGTKSVLTFRYRKGARRLDISQNGVFGTTTNVVLTASTADPIAGLSLFGAGAGVIPVNGSAPEIVIFKRALTDDERADLVAHWSEKYDI